PDLRVLATSRQRLGLAGEVVRRVPSLSSPDPERLPDDPMSAVDYALSFPAIQMFVQRATSAREGFRRAGRADAEAGCLICRRLHGLPRASELAAARVRTLSPRQIVERLDDRFGLLTTGTRTSLPRHKTLRALIDWSYDQLPGEERDLLRRLSVFMGGWTLDAV